MRFESENSIVKRSKNILAALLLAAILIGWLSVISIPPSRVQSVAAPAASQDLAMVPGTSKTAITGILTNPNFQKVLHALEQRDGTQKLPEPEATTIRDGSINHIDNQTFILPVTNR